MKTSDTFKIINGIMFEIQCEIEGAKKNAYNPHHKSRYADLNSVRDAINPLAEKHKLLIAQASEFTDQTWIVRTRLTHLPSDEWFESTTPLLNPKGDMQGLGSAITYARRYALSVMFGVCPEDDDGEGAKASIPQVLKAVQSTVDVKPASQIDPIFAETKTARFALTNVFKSSGLNQDQFKAITGLRGIQTATLDECTTAIKQLQNHKAA